MTDINLERDSRGKWWQYWKTWRKKITLLVESAFRDSLRKERWTWPAVFHLPIFPLSRIVLSSHCSLETSIILQPWNKHHFRVTANLSSSLLRLKERLGFSPQFHDHGLTIDRGIVNGYSCIPGHSWCCSGYCSTAHIFQASGSISFFPWGPVTEDS